MKYFEVEAPEGDGRCSDRACPCEDTVIPRGEGYLIVTPNVVQWRFDCPTLVEQQQKAARVTKHMNETLPLPMIREMPVPILACERAARARGARLDVAHADAAHWWSTNQVPFRVTPMLDGSLMRMNRESEILLQVMQSFERRERRIPDDQAGKLAFLSYSRFDFERILEVDDWLRSNHFQTWFDIKHLDDDKLWDDAIDAALAKAHVVLAFVSLRSNAHRGYVRHEWERALELGAPVIPMLLEEVELPAVFAGASSSFRWYLEDDRPALLRELANIERRDTAPHPRIEITPDEYLRFRDELLGAIRSSAAFRARGDHGAASNLWSAFEKKPLFNLRRNDVRAVAATASIVHAGKVERLLSALGASEPARAIVELTREILEAPPWVAGGLDPAFAINEVEAGHLNEHYLHGLISAGALFRISQSLAERGGVDPREAPLVSELFLRRVAELEEKVGPHQESFAHVFDVEPALSTLPPHLLPQARELMAEQSMLLMLDREPDDPDATLESWVENDVQGSKRGFFAVVPSKAAWARALRVRRQLIFTDPSQVKAYRAEQLAVAMDDFAMGWKIGESVAEIMRAHFLADRELPHLHEHLETLFSKERAIIELIDAVCACTNGTAPVSGVLSCSPHFVVVTANQGTKDNLRDELRPYSYDRWLQLLRILNPHLFEAKKRGDNYEVIFHFLLSGDGATLDPGLAIQDIPVMGSRFRTLFPLEMGEDDSE